MSNVRTNMPETKPQGTPLRPAVRRRIPRLRQVVAVVLLAVGISFLLNPRAAVAEFKKGWAAVCNSTMP